MERETSDSDGWFKTMETATDNLGLSDSLYMVARHVKEEFGVRLWFVEIMGPRWSYIAGTTPEHPPELDIHRIKLEENIGLVSDSWKGLPDDCCTKLVEFLNRLIAERFITTRK